MKDKEKQRELIVGIMKADEQSGLYDEPRVKLYTEEQLLKALWEALWESEHFFSDSKNVDRIIKSLTSIELPSDEEIEDKGKWVFNNAGHTIYTHYNTVPSWIEGAKWMRDKLTNTKEK